MEVLAVGVTCDWSALASASLLKRAESPARTVVAAKRRAMRRGMRANDPECPG